jgi:hypothetical protein
MEVIAHKMTNGFCDKCGLSYNECECIEPYVDGEDE